MPGYVDRSAGTACAQAHKQKRGSLRRRTSPPPDLRGGPASAVMLFARGRKLVRQRRVTANVFGCDA
jgi:hypothetical protein